MKKLKIFTLVLFLLTGSALAASEYYHYRAEDRTLPVLRCPDEPLVISVGENSREKLLGSARDIGRFARAEGLEAHARSALIRLEEEEP